MQVFIDSENKIVTECPDCHQQSFIYLIRNNTLTKGYQVEHCDFCNNPYVIDLEVKLTAKICVFKCEEIIEKE